MAKFLYIPLEFTNREIDGACLLGARALNKGISVCVGPRYQLYRYIHQLPRGVFLVKSIVPGELADLKRLKQCGHKIAYLDQEGLLLRESSYSTRERVHEDTISQVDYIFAVNEKNYEFLDKYFHDLVADKISLTGNPRIEFAAKHARNFYKTTVIPRKLIFATSFGNVNHFFGDSYYKTLRDGLAKGQRDLYAESQRYEFSKYMLEQYVELLHAITEAIPNQHIIIRPHLSENYDYWKRLFKNKPNVMVRWDQPFYYWLANAAALVQFNSTTALEADLMGVKSFGIKIPEKYKNFELNEVTAVTSMHKSVNQTVKAITEYLAFDGVSSGLQVSSDGGVELDCANRILDSIDFPEGGGYTAIKKGHSYYKSIYQDFKIKIRTRNFSNAYKNKKIEKMGIEWVAPRLLNFGINIKSGKYDVNSFDGNCLFISRSD